MQIEPRQLERAITTLRNALDDDYYGKWFITNIAPDYDGSVTVTAAYLLPDDGVTQGYQTYWGHYTVMARVGDPTVTVYDAATVTVTP